MVRIGGRAAAKVVVCEAPRVASRRKRRFSSSGLRDVVYRDVEEQEEEVRGMLPARAIMRVLRACALVDLLPKRLDALPFCVWVRAVGGFWIDQAVAVVEELRDRRAL